MDISTISPLIKGNTINSEKLFTTKADSTSGFDSLFQSMINMVSETNDLTNAAEEEEIKYAMGEDNTLELMLAQNKANLSLSYTVAVRDKVIEAYKEIMNMQF
jgi:flagellar hook-basal body complex protein FliE